MPCMCGDLCCSSCGPAQGNYHCSFCGAWTSDGGCANPEECGRLAQEQAEAEAAFDRDMKAGVSTYRWDAEEEEGNVSS